MIGTLLTHSGGAVAVSRSELNAITPPPATRTWKPIAHSELIDVLEQELGRRSLDIREEAFAIQQSGSILFGVLDLHWRQTEEFAAAIGIRTANNQLFSIQLAIGFRILVCDNLAFSGDFIALRRKHTSRLNVRDEMERALDRYQEGILHLEGDISRLKEREISDEEAKLKIFDVFHQGIMPLRFFPEVSHPYFTPKDNTNGGPVPRTLWTLHNMCTLQIQHMPPATAFPATARLGKLFGLGNTNRSFGSQN